MTPDQFAQMTYRVIADDGFSDYLPTAVFLGRREVAVLEGMPEDADPETEAVAWASARAQDGEEFLVAFKVDPSHFKIVRRFQGASESVLYRVPDA